MSKTVTNAVQFLDPIQQSFGLDRLLYVVACDDGSIYEFQKIEDGPIWTMRERGSRDGGFSQNKAPLPTGVEETLDENLGRLKWQK
jgi:hypothetical protein